nr:hypothetical protein [Tanacetum cinerariifolium]
MSVGRIEDIRRRTAARREAGRCQASIASSSRRCPVPCPCRCFFNLGQCGYGQLGLERRYLGPPSSSTCWTSIAITNAHCR